jgi:hypothetical protein
LSKQQVDKDDDEDEDDEAPSIQSKTVRVVEL